MSGSGSAISISQVRIANAQVSTFGFKSSTDRSSRLINGCKLTTNDVRGGGKKKRERGWKER